SGFIIPVHDVSEIQELTEKLIIDELDEDGLKFREGLKEIRKTKGDAVPKEFVCPLTGQIIFDPVMTNDGHTFERKAIECWLEKHDVSPITGDELSSKVVLPNFALKQLIRDFYESSQA